MTVLMLLRVKANPAKLEELSKTDDRLQVLKERGAGRGVVRHRFFATDDEVIVVDEWPSEDAFRTFMKESPEIQKLMQDAGATSEPDITVARKLDLGDDIG